VGSGKVDIPDPKQGQQPFDRHPSKLFYGFLSMASLVKIIKREKVNFRMDSTNFKNFCLLCYQDNEDGDTQVIRFSDGEHFEEIKEDLANLITRYPFGKHHYRWEEGYFEGNQNVCSRSDSTTLCGSYTAYGPNLADKIHQGCFRTATQETGAHAAENKIP
jgi:hypothetical protein